MKRVITAAAFALLVSGPVAYANGDAPQSKPVCVSQPCYTTVTTKKVIGYKEKTIRVPVYKKVKKRVKCKGECEPKVVETDGVDIPAPEPKIVEQEQRIIVRVKPVVEYAPAPRVVIQPSRPIVYQQRQTVRIAPPPPPLVTRRPICCPPGVYIRGVPPCPPNASRSGAQTGPASIGKMTGVAGNCPAGVTVGQPYQCPTSSTGWCICK